MRHASRGQITLIIGLWAVALGIGFTALWRHGGTAGASPVHPVLGIASQDSVYPLFASGSVNFAGRQEEPLLLLFAHPHCPCTVATLNELTRALSSVSSAQGSGTPARVVVVFVVPPGAPPRWERTALWHQASAMPGVQTYTDKNAILAHRFDARTSGQVFLYDKRKRLVFEGGITNGRGHEGDNAGIDAVTDLLTQAYESPRTVPPTRHTPVFGCSLL